MGPRRWAGALTSVVVAASLATACTSEDGEGCDVDGDCKGDRVCDDGECVDPSSAGD